MVLGSTTHGNSILTRIKLIRSCKPAPRYLYLILFRKFISKLTWELKQYKGHAYKTMKYDDLIFSFFFFFFKCNFKENMYKVYFSGSGVVKYCNIEQQI